jgi:hypothetical protein
MTNINDYNSSPPTPYRLFLDDIQKQIRYANSLPCPDSEKLLVLRGALDILLKSYSTDTKTIEQRVVDSYPDDKTIISQVLSSGYVAISPKITNSKWYAMFEDLGLDCIAYGGFDTEDEAKAMFGERVSYAMLISDDKLVIYPDYRSYKLVACPDYRLGISEGGQNEDL